MGRIEHLRYQLQHNWWFSEIRYKSRHDDEEWIGSYVDAILIRREKSY